MSVGHARLAHPQRGHIANHSVLLGLFLVTGRHCSVVHRRVHGAGRCFDTPLEKP
jgi:hypothetical protein